MSKRNFTNQVANIKCNGEEKHEEQENECLGKIVQCMKDHKLIADETIPEENRLAVASAQRIFYQNTELLMKKYRDIRWAVTTHFGEMAAEVELNIPMDEISTNQLYNLILTFEQNIEEEKFRQLMVYRSKYRLLTETLSMKRSVNFLLLVDKAIESIKKSHINGERIARIIQYRFIDKEVINFDDFLKENSISRATYYKDQKTGINLISTILFSAPTSKVSAIIDIVAIINEYRKKA